MKISKNSKKLMSLIMMMAFVFSSLVVTQKPAKAEGVNPTVEVIGATFRESGSQALRFAIQIENADRAYDCGITIIANGKEKTISVRRGQNKIHEINGNTITYAVAVTGIPANYAEGGFQFSGFVTPIGGATTTTNIVSRNLTQVANAAGYEINAENEEIVAKPMKGTLVGKDPSWNEGKISLDKNLGGKTVNISFKMRVQGAIADGVRMNFQTNYGGPTNPENPHEYNKIINNTWTSFSFQWNMPELDDQYPALYLSKSDDSTYDANTMKFYVKGFSVSVDDPNALEGTAVNVFSELNGNETLDTVLDPSLDKNVTQLTTIEGYKNSGIIVKFELPDGKTLADYDTLSVRIQSAQQGWKNMGIDWRESEDTQTSFGNKSNGAYTICGSTGNHYPTNQGEWRTETFSLDYSASETDVKTLQSQKGQTVYLGILYNTDPQTKVKFTDIILTKSK